MKRLAIYAHWSRRPEAAGQVLFQLEQLATLGFEILFVSNSEISAASRAALDKICSRAIIRENTGLDFAMWQHGLAEADLSGFDELLLTNSSIIGPVQPLAPLWQTAAARESDFWGLTDSQEIAPHLQSYFLVFRPEVFRSPRFAAFWRTVLPYQDKLQIIRSYEVGLTRWLEESGFKWRPVFPQAEVWGRFKAQRGWTRSTLDLILGRCRTPLNSTLFAPDILLQMGMPFVKAALLNDVFSPVNARRAFRWLAVNPPPEPLHDLLIQPSRFQ